MKKIKVILVTIILGALGSALWELALKPIFVVVYEHIVLYALSSFNDSFYVLVSEGLGNAYLDTFKYISLIIAVLILIPPRFFDHMLHRKPKSQRDYIVQSVAKLIAVIMLFSSMSITFIAHQTARDTLNSIEIVAPYILDTEYKTLKSDFYRMDSKADFLNLTKQIEDIMETNNLSD